MHLYGFDANTDAQRLRRSWRLHVRVGGRFSSEGHGQRLQSQPELPCCWPYRGSTQCVQQLQSQSGGTREGRRM